MTNIESNLSLNRGLLATMSVIFALVMTLGVAGADSETALASITNLQNVTGETWINWTWTNPDDEDFNHTMVYLDGVLKDNVSEPFYNATGLTPETEYEIGTHTVDKAGIINMTWVNQTTKTEEAVESAPKEPVVVIKPETLNLKSRGVFTAFITLPEDYNVMAINLSTVKCGNATAVRGMAAGLIYIAKFKRQDLRQDLGIETTANNVTLTVTGKLSDGRTFSGSDNVTVKNGGIQGEMTGVADKSNPKPKGKEK